MSANASACTKCKINLFLTNNYSCVDSLNCQTGTKGYLYLNLKLMYKIQIINSFEYFL